MTKWTKRSKWIVGQAYSRIYSTPSQLSRLQTICVDNNSKLRFIPKSYSFTKQELAGHYLNLGLKSLLFFLYYRSKRC
jgi:hypothetical protein